MMLMAPAKINLHLRVATPRADGFHPLMTWMTTIGLFDSLTLMDTPGDILMTCSDHSLPCDDRNLVMKAAKLLRGDTANGVAIHLEKKIPHGGGLGGGSSDAAATLVGLNRLWKLSRSIESLHEAAASLGSDIPFFLHGPSSVCFGRGEIVQPISAPTVAKWVLLILPSISMPTLAVYRQFDEMKLGRDEDIKHQPDWNQWARLPAKDLLPNLVNDLEPPAFKIAANLGELRTSIEQTLSRPVRMSGSGSSLFTLFDEKAQAAVAAKTISDLYQLRAMEAEMCLQD